jgi:hypothetical protein
VVLNVKDANPLPLKLNPFEFYMLTDDRDSHPMTQMALLRFSGKFNRLSFSSALRKAIARHPLVGANVKGKRFGEATWVPSPDPFPPIDYGDLGEPMRFAAKERIDLFSETGLRVWVRSDSTTCLMRFQIHHSCCDGVGGYQFLEDLLCLYAIEEDPSFDGCCVELNADLLTRRTRFGLSRLQTLLRLPLDIAGIPIGLAILFFRQPAPLSSPKTPATTEPPARRLLDFPVHTFDDEQVVRLRAGSRAAGATLNEFMLTNLFLALQQWNSKHDSAAAERKLRIMVPVNLRGQDDAAMPAANAVGMVPVDRRVWRYSDPERLLKTIRLGMTIVKRLRLGIIWIRALNVLSRLPGAMQFVLRRDRTHATCVWSNSGKVFAGVRSPRRDGKIVAGDLTLETVSSAPPVRPGASASFTVLGYAGKLTLVMNYDRTYFTANTAEALMNTVVDRVEKSIATTVVGSAIA